MKKGRLSLEEQEFILQNVTSLDVNEIGSSLNRDPKTIRTYITEKLNLVPIEPGKFTPKTPEPSTGSKPEPQTIVRRADPTERAIISNDLRNTEAWKRLSDEFTERELPYFEERYIEMVTSFSDVAAAEIIQIFQAIKFEILMSRNMASRKRALEGIEFLEDAQAEFLQEHCPGGSRKGLAEPVLTKILELETQINAARADEQSKTAEFAKLHERHGKLMEALKATRDQRLDKVEEKKIKFLDIIRDLQQRDIQEREGRQMELMRIAGERELMNLGRPVIYEDGNQDSPILCDLTVDLGPAEDE